MQPRKLAQCAHWLAWNASNSRVVTPLAITRRGHGYHQAHRGPFSAPDTVGTGHC